MNHPTSLYTGFGPLRPSPPRLGIWFISCILRPSLSRWVMRCNLRNSRNQPTDPHGQRTNHRRVPPSCASIPPTLQPNQVESASQAAQKVETELGNLQATLKDIESARPFDQLTVRVVVISYASLAETFPVWMSCAELGNQVEADLLCLLLLYPSFCPPSSPLPLSPGYSTYHRHLRPCQKLVISPFAGFHRCPILHYTAGPRPRHDRKTDRRRRQGPSTAHKDGRGDGQERQVDHPRLHGTLRLPPGALVAVM